MLAQPDRPNGGGFLRSRTQHRNPVNRFCDWLEATVLVEGATSYPDIVDFLTENLVYDSDDFAWEFLSDVQAEVRRRAVLLGDAYPFLQTGGEELREQPGPSRDAYAFCLALSLPFLYQGWAAANVPPAGNHRALFESLAELACIRLFPGWLVLNFAWSAKTPAQKGAVVERVANELHGTVRDGTVFAHANDGGVDILCHRRFPDSLGGYPALLVQCATGITNYANKAVEPNLNLWRDAVQLRNYPKRALAVPFALDGEELRGLTSAADGVVLDRVRMLAPFAGEPPDVAFSAELSAWSDAALAALPRST